MKLVILDRDGVINEDSPDYIRRPEDWRALPGSAEAIARLTAAGFTVTVATNQSGLGRGLLDLAALHAIHRRMDAAIAAAGGRIHGVFYCPHGPDEGCACRKPQPALLREIERRFRTDLTAVPTVGDSARDLQAARAVGARPILVLTGKGRVTQAALGSSAAVETYADLAAVTDRLLQEPR